MDLDTTKIDRAIVLAGGELHTRPDPSWGAIVIAADSGYDHALDLGLAVDILVGDMDSISSAGLDHARTHGVDVLHYPADKDQSDLELAILAAAARNVQRIDVHGGEGGSLGHLLGVALELTDHRWRDIDLQWHTRGGVARPAEPGRSVIVVGSEGDTVSLVPVGDVAGVTTTGLAWPLDDEPLPAGTTRGLSNRLSSARAEVTVRSGTLLVIWEGGST